jgi:cytochrome c oxidase subunit 2
MEKKELKWFIILIAIALVFNIITLTPLIPWQSWLLWNRPSPDKSFFITFENNEIILPEAELEIETGEYIEFAAVSKDVTYGLGIFRDNGTMVFQMQVLPARENKFIWKFEEPGYYTIRSTEYSGPKHSDMVIENAILVSEN